MAEARSIADWNHTSALLAMTANVNRDPKKTRPFKPGQFHPHDARHRRSKRRVSVEQLTREVLAVSAAKERQRRRKATGK